MSAPITSNRNFLIGMMTAHSRQGQSSRPLKKLLLKTVLSKAFLKKLGALYRGVWSKK